MAVEFRMPSVGETLKGVYHLQGVLGEGGFAKAFSGKDVETNAAIAVKVLKLTSAKDILQFSLEAFRMLQLTHPNIVKVTDYDAEEGTFPFIVMPLAAKGSLGGEIQTRRGRGEHMPLERSIEAIEQIGDALEYLHQKRIIHQDVKPDNILLPNERDFLLSDLGIARVLKPVDSIRPLDTGFTPQYVSPEQSLGRAVLASDQYSLGVTAYLLLTGRLPFIDTSVAELVHKHRTEKPISLVDAVQALKNGERMITILRALDPIVQKSIAKKPEDRYDTVMTFARTLKKTAEDAAQEKPTGKSFPGVDVPTEKDTVEISPTVPVRVEDWIKQCVALYKQKKYTELLHASEQAIALDPNNADGWFYKGLSLCRFGKYEETLEPYDRVLELEPTQVVAMRNKADSLNHLGRHEEALQLLNKALRIAPTYVRALNDKGIALNALGRNEEAIAAYDHAIRINPGYSNVFVCKGVALNALRRNEEAIAAYDHAIRINPQDSWAYNNKGVALNALGRREEAIAAYDHAIKINPQYSKAYFNKGVALNALGRREEAIAAYDQAIRVNPGYSRAYNSKGATLRKLGRHEEAVAAYDKSLQINPQDSWAYVNKGGALCSLGKFKEAQSCFQQAMENNPSEQVVRFINQLKQQYHLP